MDYNADIPFEKRPALGFYDTTEEHNRPVDHTKLTNVHLSKLNQRKADRDEEQEREKKRKAREKQATGGDEGNKGNFVLASNMKVNKIQEAEQIAKRRKLVLPTPQVGESELEQIVKVGFAGQNAANLDEDGNAATAGLVGDYSITPSGGQPARTPRTTAASMYISIYNSNNLKYLHFLCRGQYYE
jgi:pre-mRNA-splicing factor CDC5/CEF1